MLPTFIGIGPGRTGTSMLYEALRAHPQVAMARGTKETNYFAHEYYRGQAWYAAFFEGGEGKKAVGEISNVYFYDTDVPARMHRLVPDARLFSCLRNPFERLRSVFLYRKRSGEIEPEVTLEKALQQYPDLITDSCYATKLAAYFRYFDRDQVLILFYEDLDRQPESFIASLFAFIGVDHGFKPDVLNERVNASAQPRTRWLGTLAATTAQTLRRYGLLFLLDRAKRSRMVRNMVLKSVDAPEHSVLQSLSPDTRARLKEIWTPEVYKIEQWSGRSLAHWLDPAL